MPVKYYLDKRLNKHGEAPIRIVWSFSGDRFQSTMKVSIPPASWDAKSMRVTWADVNHKKTSVHVINLYLDALEKAAYRMENEANVQNTALTKLLVKRIFEDVMGAGGEYPLQQEQTWKRMLKERNQNKVRYFEHFKGGKYKLIGFGKDAETQGDVVIYQSLYGAGQIWVRPYDIFFGTVNGPEGEEVARYREIFNI